MKTKRKGREFFERADAAATDFTHTQFVNKYTHIHKEFEGKEAIIRVS